MTMVLLILHWVCRVVLAGIFIYSGYVKAQEPLQFAVAISGYRVVPENLIFPVATYFPWIEIALGVLLLIGWKIRYVSAATAVLLLFFLVLIGSTFARGIEADCGCFGFGEPITAKTILRDSLFLLPALYLVFEPWIRARSGKDQRSALVENPPSL